MKKRNKNINRKETKLLEWPKFSDDKTVTRTSHSIYRDPMVLGLCALPSHFNFSLLLYTMLTSFQRPDFTVSVAASFVTFLIVNFKFPLYFSG